MSKHVMSKAKGETRKAACGCDVVGKDAQGKPLAECGVQGFRYYGGRCKADEPRIVAECWTCAKYHEYADSRNLAEVDGPLGVLMTEPERIARHRAAGHDVRPVQKGR